MLESFLEQGIIAFLDVHYAKRAAHYLGGVGEEEAAVLAAAMAAARQGHLCLDRRGEILPLDESSRALFQPLLERGFEKIKTNPFLHLDGDRAYLPKNWALEQTLRRHLVRLSQRHGEDKIPDFLLSAKLNTEQKQAVAAALHHSLTLLTGGPGTGKTFTAAAIAQAFLTRSPAANIFLAAPTARAADHLKKKILPHIDPRSLGFADTLHKLLGYKNIQHPPQVPCLKTDLIIVDECSMIDAQIFVALFACMSEHSAIVLMGDPDQLHPVGIGSLFSDLVRADTSLPLARVHLQHCLRVEDRPLLELAAAVQNGQPCTWPLLDWPLDDREVFYEKLWAYSKHLWPRPSTHAPEKTILEHLSHFRILSALRQGPFGTDQLNEMLVRRFSAQAKLGDFWTAPIQITRNDPSTGLCNGEPGILVHSRTSRYAMFPSLEHPLPAAMLPAYEYAFCSSVHKSQGSEYDEVLLIAPPGSESFGREMLYTGITRAKKRLHVASNQEILSKMQSNQLRKLSGLLKH